MLGKSVADLAIGDIQHLVDNQVCESRTLEYKLKLPPTTDKDKKEFLADVSSFANATGGDLIYGVEAIDGCPVAVPGLCEFNEDKELLRLEATIRDAIDPRIQGVRFKTIQGFADGPVLLIRLPKSWTAPHMVTFKGGSRFFTRSSAGKFQMDVDELRTAFEGAGRIPEQIRDWRTERLGLIIADEGPMQVPETGRLVVHLVPLRQFEGPDLISVETLYESFTLFPPLSKPSGCRRLNLDGVVTF